MYDALLYNIELAQQSPILEQMHLEPKMYILATLHRASNTDNANALKRIITGLSQVGKTVVFPVHPRTRKALKTYGISPGENTLVTNPVGYLDFLKLESEAAAIVTDSGGIQKEAYILRIPCITVREETEWVETVEDGWNTLVGTDTDLIIRKVQEFRPDRKQRQLFGDGTASHKIVHILKECT
jgi:UDP-N-acetylglucosamine 2-epimerase (non-hydrolysing)